MSCRKAWTTEREPSGAWAFRTSSRSGAPERWRNWRSASVRASSGSAARTSRFKPRAPWLPPVTSRTGRFGSRPKALRAAAGSRCSRRRAMASRTGVPTHRELAQSSRRTAPGKPVKAWQANRARSRLARPGIVLDSWRNPAAPRSRAARNGGAAVNPPMARIAWGRPLPDANRRWDAHQARQNPATKARTFPSWSPVAGSVATSFP